MAPHSSTLAGKSHVWKSLVGCSPWGREESETTEWLHFQFSLSCIGEGNGNPLQCSCLENPRDGGAWWAAVYGVPQSQTWLKRLSSSSSSKGDIELQVRVKKFLLYQSSTTSLSCMGIKFAYEATYTEDLFLLGTPLGYFRKQGWQVHLLSCL